MCIDIVARIRSHFAGQVLCVYIYISICIVIYTLWDIYGDVYIVVCV